MCFGASLDQVSCRRPNAPLVGVETKKATVAEPGSFVQRAGGRFSRESVVMLQSRHTSSGPRSWECECRPCSGERAWPRKGRLSLERRTAAASPTESCSPPRQQNDRKYFWQHSETTFWRWPVLPHGLRTMHNVGRIWPAALERERLVDKLSDTCAATQIHCLIFIPTACQFSSLSTRRYQATHSETEKCG